MEQVYNNQNLLGSHAGQSWTHTEAGFSQPKRGGNE